MNKIRAGIVGCGGIANAKHLPAIRATGDVDLVAFCDIIIERAEQACATYGAEGAKVYEDYKELLKDDSIQAIYVCTPNRSHSFITIDALDAGKHVMCEKPMAKTYAEAVQMVEAAHRVLGQGFLEQAVTVDGIVEFGNRLKQGVRRETCQQALETAESQGTLIEVFHGFRSIQAETSHEFMHPPELAVLIHIAILAFLGRNKAQGHSGIRDPLPQILSYCADITHQPDRILKNILVNPLQNIFSTGISCDFKCTVNMSMAEILTRNRLSIHFKRVGCFYDVHRRHPKLEYTSSVLMDLRYILSQILQNCKQNYARVQLFPDFRQKGAAEFYNPQLLNIICRSRH